MTELSDVSPSSQVPERLGATGIVWLASYPKSGNTWFRAVYDAAVSGRVDLNHLRTGPSAADRSRFDLTLGISSSRLTTAEIDRLRPRVDEALLAREAVEHPVKTHDALLPAAGGEPVLSTVATRAAIYLVRDPRDVAVSFSHHEATALARTVARMADPTATLGAVPNGVGNQLVQRLGSWSQHVESWLDTADFPVHVLRYEDCLADPVRAFGEALTFLGRDLDEQHVRFAVDQASFTRLRDQERRGGFRERPAHVSSFFRSGRTGAWRGVLAPDLSERIEREHGDVMRRLGYL